MYEIKVDGYTIAKRTLTPEEVKKYNNTPGVTVEKENRSR